jgi:hypothetical protein
VKAYGGVGVGPLTLISEKDGVNRKHHAPTALHPKDESSILFEQEAGWASTPVWTVWRKDFLILSRIESRFFGSTACSQVIVPRYLYCSVSVCKCY